MGNSCFESGERPSWPMHGDMPGDGDWVLNEDNTISPALARHLVLGLGDSTSQQREKELEDRTVTMMRYRLALTVTGLCIVGTQGFSMTSESIILNIPYLGLRFIFFSTTILSFNPFQPQLSASIMDGRSARGMKSTIYLTSVTE